MVIKTLMYNIKQELQNQFSSIENFQDILIKEVYEENPKIKYPMITIQEFDNSEEEQYSSNLGEEFSSLGYQVNAMCKNLPNMQAIDAVRLMTEEINKVLGIQLGMVRETPTPPSPLPSDNNVLISSVRYTCIFDLNENRIYKN